MEIIAGQLNASLILALGDNFYEYGLHGNEYAPRFAATFEDVYAGAALDRCIVQVVLGNHDYLGNVSAQVAYTQHSARWRLPALYYKESYAIGTRPDGSPATMDIVFLDTVVLAGNSDLQEDPFGPLPGPEDALAASAQWAFIEDALANSTADYLFTAGHYPVWSGCQHGPTLELVTKLRPMLEKYNASGHFSGHDHCLEHVDEGRGPVYAVVGAGDECCYHNKNAQRIPTGALKFAVWNDGSGSPIEAGFGSFTATPAELTIRYHAANGTLLYVADPVHPRRQG